VGLDWLEGIVSGLVLPLKSLDYSEMAKAFEGGGNVCGAP
jgi:hypothetical protein